MSEPNNQNCSFRLLILGGGPVVRLLHLPAIQSLGWTSDCMVVDTNTDSLARLQTAAPLLKVAQRGYEEALADKGITSQFDGALVALPNRLHELATTMAIRAGLPVLCEKPLVMNIEECARLQKIESESGLRVCVAMVMRHLPGLVAMRHAIASGKIGEVQRVDISDGSPFAWDSESGGYFTKSNGGVLLNMGVHFLDLISWLTGPLEPLSYQDDAAKGVEANFEFALRTQSASVRLEVSYTRLLRNTIEITGSTGALTFDKANPQECVWTDSSGTLSGRISPKRNFKYGQWEPTMLACYADQLAAFASTEGRGELATTQDAHATSVLIQWCENNRSLLREDVNRVIVTPAAREALSGPVVVTGGTGFVGGRLLGALAQASIETSAAVRSFTNGATAGRYGIKLAKCDLLDTESLCETFRGAKHVFHLAYGSGGPDSRKVTIDGAVNACRAAVQEGVESIIIVGTTAIYGSQPEGTVVDESFNPRTRGTEYELSKAEMVRQVLRFANSDSCGKTQVTILEPACIYGPGSKPFTELPALLAKSGQFAWVAEGKGLANVVYVDNFVDAMLRAAVRRETHGHRIIVQDTVVTWREFLTPILGPFAERVNSLSPHEFKPRKIRIKDVVSSVFRSAEFTSTLAQWPLTQRIRPVVERLAPGMANQLRKMKSGSGSALQIRMANDDLVSQSQVPEWVAKAFGTESPPLSNEKARRMLDWQPMQLIRGHEKAVAWLRYAEIHPRQFSSEEG